MVVKPVVPEGRAELLPDRVTVPELAPMTSAPVKVLLPVRASAPRPAFVSPAPEMTPPMVSLLPETVMVREAGIDTAPVPRLRSFEPVKVKSQVELLIVDDQELERESLSQILKLAGHDVVTAEGGIAAISILKQHSVKLILLDLNMPDFNIF